MQIKSTSIGRRFVILIGLIGFGMMIGWTAYRRHDAVKTDVNDQQLVRNLVASEELILSLTPRLQSLSRSVLNLRLSGGQAADMFSSHVEVSDLDEKELPRLIGEHPSVSCRRFSWPLASSKTYPVNDLQLWRPFISKSQYFENAKFYFVSGEFTDSGFAKFQSEIGFNGLAKTKGGIWNSIRAKCHVVWRRHNETDRNDSDWRISEWTLQDFQTIENSRLLFSDVRSSAIPREADRRRATTSRHREILLENYFGGVPAQLPVGYRDSRFFPDSNAMHPGLAVVDIDGDGFDDLYVTVRWGKNQLWRNQGDGTFHEDAAAYGLDIEGRSSCALFADFDNDGDPDLMLGRTLEQSMYLANEGGTFVDHTKECNVKLPFLVTSLSAADFNNDGLLDVYFSTYTPIIFNERFSEERKQATVLANEYLTGEDAIEFRSRYEQPHHRLFSEVGPPNLLLVNRGNGQFDVASENQQVQVWRNTFQSTWADFDSDGDVDLYVANDFATDHLFRNDRSQGFVDVTEAMSLDEMGFGMGVTWGDYDNDGDQDLYVSNMYSKAGTRIISRMADIDDRFGKAVEGNFLYRNDGTRFELVSGQSSEMKVSRAGWAWGGQFADFDNDRFLDLYVSSGYYTVPEAYSTNVDL